MGDSSLESQVELTEISHVDGFTKRLH